MSPRHHDKPVPYVEISEVSELIPTKVNLEFRVATDNRSHRRSSAHAHLNPCFTSGNERTRVPVALKIALQTAGRIGGSAGSPHPVGLLSLVLKWTSISFGAYRIRIGSYSLKFVCVTRPLAIVISKPMRWLSPSITDPWACASAFSGLMIWRAISPAAHTLLTFTRFCASTLTSATSAKWPWWLKWNATPIAVPCGSLRVPQPDLSRTR